MGSEIVICPVCNGRGMNKAGFYPDVDKDKGPQKCQACEGRGIILVPETDTTYVPYYPPIEPATPYPPWEPPYPPWTPWEPQKIWYETETAPITMPLYPPTHIYC